VMEGFGHLDGCVVRYVHLSWLHNQPMFGCRPGLRHHEDRCTGTMSVLDTRVHVCGIGLELLAYINNLILSS
jgi:hypothetical protein